MFSDDLPGYAGHIGPFRPTVRTGAGADEQKPESYRVQWLNKARWPRAHRRAQPRSLAWRLGVPGVCAAAGLLGATSMINAQGTDLRGGRHTDLIGLVGAQRREVQDLQRTLAGVQSEVDELVAQAGIGTSDSAERKLRRLETPAGLRALTGPGLVVTLDDAPLDQPVPDGADPNVLLVHQQDIQAVVNALWAGGAEGISLQGQRLISTTGIKCVGNTVLLQGVPYSPPYRVQAVGNTEGMSRALNSSPEVSTYLDYTAAPYNLGWSLRADASLQVPAYSGSLTLQFARPAADDSVGPGG